MALLSMLLELSPTATAAEEAPLPAAFLEFLAEMIEEDGELLDPLLLAPETLEREAGGEAARLPDAVRDENPVTPPPAERTRPAQGDAPEAAPEASSRQGGSRARAAGGLAHV